jgi:hypothetical protein
VVARQKKGAKRAPRDVEESEGQEESQVQVFTFREQVLVHVSWLVAWFRTCDYVCGFLLSKAHNKYLKRNKTQTIRVGCGSTTSSDNMFGLCQKAVEPTMNRKNRK